ncbi:MAG: protein nirH [Gammaproteobacteria bacterium CG22_combo_CG10-13_8_21_14_all_40_8]|nr:MAG: protein nirH [Gammaproteobacteria bacterium CG22_combo_CG10-13_8_21_14_all_40_8]
MITDRKIVEVLQEGLNLTPTPYADAAVKLGMTEADLMLRLEDMMEQGAIRRIALVPNHYAIGYRFNAMTVWDVDDDSVDIMGDKFGQEESVSHCYRRPRRHPEWRYNLFAMVHGRGPEEVEQKILHLKSLAGQTVRDHRVLMSRKILKKTGLRLATNEGKLC